MICGFSRTVLEGPERRREASICGGGRTTACSAPPGSPKLQIQASAKKDHQETEAGGAGPSAPQLSPGRCIGPRDESGLRRRLWRFCLRTSRQPSSTSPVTSPVGVSRGLQRPPGWPSTPGAGELWPAYPGNVPIGCSGRGGRGLGLFSPAHAGGGRDGGLE